MDPFLKRLKKLQTVFGDLNDAATVRAMLSGAEAPGAGESAAQRAVGWVIGASQARRIWLGWRKGPVEESRGDPPLLEVTWLEVACGRFRGHEDNVLTMEPATAVLIRHQQPVGRGCASA